MLICGFGQKYKEFSCELRVLGVLLLLETLCLPFKMCSLDHRCACSKIYTWSIPAGPSLWLQPYSWQWWILQGSASKGHQMTEHLGYKYSHFWITFFWAEMLHIFEQTKFRGFN